MCPDWYGYKQSERGEQSANLRRREFMRAKPRQRRPACNVGFGWRKHAYLIFYYPSPVPSEQVMNEPPVPVVNLIRLAVEQESGNPVVG